MSFLCQCQITHPNILSFTLLTLLQHTLNLTLLKHLWYSLVLINQWVNIGVQDLLLTQCYQACCHGSNLSSKTGTDRVITPKRTSTYFISAVNIFDHFKSEQFCCRDDVNQFSSLLVFTVCFCAIQKLSTLSTKHKLITHYKSCGETHLSNNVFDRLFKIYSYFFSLVTLFLNLNSMRWIPDKNLEPCSF